MENTNDPDDQNLGPRMLMTLTITTRDELAPLWLPWCVGAGEPSVPIVHPPSLHPHAKQVAICDLNRTDIGLRSSGSLRMEG